MDGQNPAPPTKPWIGDSPTNANKQWLPMVSQVVRHGFRNHPQYVQNLQIRTASRKPCWFSVGNQGIHPGSSPRPNKHDLVLLSNQKSTTDFTKSTEVELSPEAEEGRSFERYRLNWGAGRHHNTTPDKGEVTCEDGWLVVVGFCFLFVCLFVCFVSFFVCLFVLFRPFCLIVLFACLLCV